MITIETDVLVIGTGGAGCRAAIEAKKHVDKVIILSKGPISKSELTIMTMPGFDATLPWDEKENVRLFFEDTMAGGSFLNDEDLVDVLTKKSADAVMFLESLGVRFDRTPDGKIYRAVGESEKYTSDIKLRLDDNMGRTFFNALIGELARKQIFLKEDVFIINLLASDGEVVGALGIDIRKGDIITFLAKSTIIAAGGAGGIYSVRTGHPRDTGDGYAMAFRAGAEIIDMEFIQSNPAALVYPESVKGVVTPGWYLFMGKGIKYFNKNREAFLEHYDSRKEMATRDVKARAMHTEIVEGRGSEHGGIYLDFKNIQLEGISLEDYLKKNSPHMLNYVKLCGLPPEKILTDVIEVGPAAHFTCGGIKINTECKTNLKGLFAAGEVTGGIHGANRLAGNAMTDIFVFGEIAGDQAVIYAKSKGKIKFSQKMARLVRKEEEQAISIMKREEKGGLRPGEVRKKLEEAMFKYVGFGRDEKGLKKGIRILEEIRAEELPRIYPPDRLRIYNYDWIQILELYNMVDTGEMIAKGALYRKETRGCQNRTDFPEKDDRNWQKHTLLRKEGDKMIVTKSPRITISKP
jgi:fumarate reductase (CoM/CoB) subunit A